MSDHKIIEGGMVLEGSRFAVVVGRWNSFIVEQLLEGALDTLRRHGAKEKEIEIIRAPGAFEIPLVAKRLAAAKKYDAIIALGAVIRGATPHFEYVAGECTKGLTNVSMAFDIPVAFGVLTVDTIEQAIERAGTKGGNKGEEAALATIEMVNLLKQI